MKFGISQRLFLSILGAAALAIVTLFLVVQWSLDRGFNQYLRKMDQTRLEEWADNIGRRYAEQGTWSFLENGILPRGGPLVVLDQDRQPVFGNLPPGREIESRPIMAHGRIVGFAGLIPPQQFLHPRQVEFLKEQRLALALAAAGLVLAAALLALLLARHLIRPVKTLASATRDIASGQYGIRLPVRSSDELGSLARDFNEMAGTLEKHEMARRQWIADISHELRTPVAVLQGEIEALLDGIRPITKERIRSLHGETLRLNRLVEDLYQLSLSDLGALTYRKEPLDPSDLLRRVVETFQPAFQDKGLGISLQLPSDPKQRIFGDRERLEQLFTNLVENSLRFTDPGGQLRISGSGEGGRVVIEFQDSPPGVPAAELDRLFDRFYRLEGSRSRAFGGAGLGLAICKNIVEAHSGTISAHASPWGGLLIRISLPRAGGPS
ncbi:MAG: HAMP domain-containing protein [Deltaproteobacteria bacterium]|nr:HAMP domain-containing protein [Deltaproteobacteria bacterium]